jgi:hypothetical protein
MRNRPSITGLTALLPAFVAAAFALPLAVATPGVLAGHPWAGNAPAEVGVDGYPWVGAAPAGEPRGL